METAGEILLVLLQVFDDFLEFRDLSDQRDGVLATCALGADLLRFLIAQMLMDLDLGLRRSPIFVERQHPVRVRFHAAPGEAGVEGVAVLANPSGAEHDGRAFEPSKILCQQVYAGISSVRRSGEQRQMPVMMAVSMEWTGPWMHVASAGWLP